MGMYGVSCRDVEGRQQVWAGVACAGDFLFRANGGSSGLAASISFVETVCSCQLVVLVDRITCQLWTGRALVRCCPVGLVLARRRPALNERAGGGDDSLSIF